MTARLPEAEPLLLLWKERSENLGRNSQKLLELLDKYDPKAMVEAIAEAIAKNAPAVESIAYILAQSHKPVRKPMNVVLPVGLNQTEIRSHDPSQYDLLSNCYERQNHGTNDGP